LIEKRTLQDFIDQGKSEDIAKMRVEYYEDKRRGYTLQLEDSIKKGIIESIKAENVPFVR